MRNKVPPDLILMEGGAFPVVSQRVKDKLEELEPGAHDYFPLKITNRRGKRGSTVIEEELPGTYYMMYVWQRPDIIDHERTAYGRDRLGGVENAQRASFFFARFSRRVQGRREFAHLINFKSPGHAGHHLWRGSLGRDLVVAKTPERIGKTIYVDSMAKGAFFVSDAFADFMRAEKITGYVTIRIFEKPIEWLHEQVQEGNWE